MSEGLAALLGAIVGGGLVVFGDLAARSLDEAREVKAELRARASELLSFEWHRENLAREQRTGETDIPTEQLKALYDRERRQAAAAVFVNPHGMPLLEPMIKLMGTTNRLVAVTGGPDTEWTDARNEFIAARDRFQEAVRSL